MITLPLQLNKWASHCVSSSTRTLVPCPVESALTMTKFLLGRPIGERLYTHSDFLLLCFAGRRMACHHGDWRVYTPSCLVVPAVTVGWPGTKGTASNERVHSFCKDGFISIVTRSLISLWNAVCSTGRWSIIGRCFGACQRSSCAEERRPQ